jgi:hypothetical protein
MALHDFLSNFLGEPPADMFGLFSADQGSDQLLRSSEMTRSVINVIWRCGSGLRPSGVRAATATACDHDLKSTDDVGTWFQR